MLHIQLNHSTDQDWVNTVLADFDRFLLDHATAEKKAAGMAISMLSHYPDKPELVEAMADLAVEEMSHYRQVVTLIHGRGLVTAADEKDPYVNALRQCIRKGSDAYFLDRLLVGGVIEARGAERFGLVGQALPAGNEKNFYIGLARSEQRHQNLFVELALRYFDEATVAPRLAQLIAEEAAIATALPLRPALH